MKSKTKQDALSKYQFFKHVLDSMADLVYIVNKNKGIEYINPAMKKVFGPIKGKKCYEYMAALPKPCSWCRQKEVWDGQTIRWEWNCKRLDKIYDVIETPLHYSDDKIYKLKIMRDVTNIKIWEEKIEKERDLLKNIMENTHSMMAYLDRDFNFIHVNTAYAKGSGHTINDLLGKNHFTLFPHKENKAIFEKVRDTGKPVEYKEKN
ncbi:MAG: PAS domain S-box protein [bacterium]